MKMSSPLRTLAAKVPISQWPGTLLLFSMLLASLALKLVIGKE